MTGEIVASSAAMHTRVSQHFQTYLCDAAKQAIEQPKVGRDAASVCGCPEQLRGDVGSDCEMVALNACGRRGRERPGRGGEYIACATLLRQKCIPLINLSAHSSGVKPSAAPSILAVRAGLVLFSSSYPGV